MSQYNGWLFYVSVSVLEAFYWQCLKCLDLINHEIMTEVPLLTRVLNYHNFGLMSVFD